MNQCSSMPHIHGCGNPGYNIYSWRPKCTHMPIAELHRIHVLERTLFGDDYDWREYPNGLGVSGNNSGSDTGNSGNEGGNNSGDNSGDSGNTGTGTNTGTDTGTSTGTNTSGGVLGRLGNIENGISKIQEMIQDISFDIPFVVLTQAKYDKLVEDGKINEGVFYYTYDGDLYPDDPDKPDDPDTPDTPDVPTPSEDVYIQNHVLYVPGSVSGHMLTINGTVNNHTLTL